LRTKKPAEEDEKQYKYKPKATKNAKQKWKIKKKSQKNDMQGNQKQTQKPLHLIQNKLEKEEHKQP